MPCQQIVTSEHIAQGLTSSISGSGKEQLMGRTYWLQIPECCPQTRWETGLGKVRGDIAAPGVVAAPSHL